MKDPLKPGAVAPSPNENPRAFPEGSVVLRKTLPQTMPHTTPTKPTAPTAPTKPRARAKETAAAAVSMSPAGNRRTCARPQPAVTATTTTTTTTTATAAAAYHTPQGIVYAQHMPVMPGGLACSPYSPVMMSRAGTVVYPVPVYMAYPAAGFTTPATHSALEAAGSAWLGSHKARRRTTPRGRHTTPSLTSSPTTAKGPANRTSSTSAKLRRGGALQDDGFTTRPSHKQQHQQELGSSHSQPLPADVCPTVPESATLWPARLVDTWPQPEPPQAAAHTQTHTHDMKQQQQQQQQGVRASGWASVVAGAGSSDVPTPPAEQRHTLAVAQSSESRDNGGEHDSVGEGLLRPLEECERERGAIVGMGRHAFAPSAPVEAAPTKGSERHSEHGGQVGCASNSALSPDADDSSDSASSSPASLSRPSSGLGSGMSPPPTLSTQAPFALLSSEPCP